MSEPLVELTRGPLAECLHHGDLAVADAGGITNHYAGDPDKVTYFRSAAKPIQALEIVLSGARDRFRFSDAELAVMCASHYGEDFHRAAVASILSKIGLDQTALHCGSTPSISPKVALATAYNGIALSPLFSDCSGKHAGMLAVCVHRGYDIATYTDSGHPLQLRMRSLVAEVCGLPPEKIVIGIDGCSVPVFGLPLSGMARGFARLAAGQGLQDEVQSAARQVYTAMNAHPEMIAGTGGFCSELIRNAHGKLIAKLGAEGVYCVGLRDRALGIALKIEDGNTRAIAPVIMQVLADLQALEPGELQSLDRFWHKPNRNAHKTVVGQYRTVFTLQTANTNG